MTAPEVCAELVEAPEAFGGGRRRVDGNPAADGRAGETNPAAGATKD
jgi:hypothetical protein